MTFDILDTFQILICEYLLLVYIVKFGILNDNKG